MTISYGENTYTSISQRTNTYAETKMLEYAHAVVVLGKFGSTKPLPKNKANNITFRRPVPFDAASAPLVEGITPSSQKQTFVDVTATIAQYGAVSEITDVVEDTVEDPVLNEIVKTMADQAAKTIEAVTYGVVRAGTNVIYANGTIRTSVNTPITLNIQRHATRFLNAQKAMKISKIQDASVNYGTSAVEAAYVACAHTDLEHDIRQFAGFVPTAQYGNRRTLCDQEIGSVESVRYVLSADLSPFADAGGVVAGASGTMVSTTGISTDVYPILFFGEEAFGLVPLKGMGSIEPVIIPASNRSKSDPLGQRGVVGWKTYFAAVRLNESWMVRVECGATSI